MKQQINEVKRMQQLAGVINENEIPTVYNVPEQNVPPEIKPVYDFLEKNGWVIEEFGKTKQDYWFSAVKSKTPVNITT